MYAGGRTEERINICTRQEGPKKDLHMYAARRTDERI